MSKHCFFASLFALLSASPALAGNAPKQFYNKTITIVWVESIRERTPDGRTLTPQTTQQRIIYISSLGRVFVRSKAQNRGAANQRDHAPENAKSGSISFHGSTMSGISMAGSLARQLQASFDPSFSSCSANVTVGKSSETAHWTSVDGKTELMVDEVKVGAVTCAIADGNSL
jgi:hypothetical protein